MKRFGNNIMRVACLILIPTMVMAVDTSAPVPAKEKNVSDQAAPSSVAAPSKIGSIDISYVGMESEYGKSFKAELAGKKGKVEAKILAEKKKLDTLKESIESKLSTYTPKQREAKSKEFQKKVETFQKLVREAEESFMKEQESGTNKIISLIEKTVLDYGKANNFAIIVVKRDLLYVDSGIKTQDLTSIILKAVNDTWKKK